MRETQCLLIGHGKIRELTPSEFEDLSNFLEIVRHDHGAATPIEAFIAGLVSHHAMRPMTLEDVLWQIENELQPTWEMTVRDSVRFAHRYPQVLRDQLPQGFVYKTAEEVQKESEAEERQTKQAAEEAEAEARAQAEKARDAREKAAWAKRHPKEAARIQEFIQWAKTLDSQSQLIAASEPHELWKSAVLRSIEEENTKKKAASTTPKANKAPRSGKRGAPKSATLDEKARTLSAPVYTVSGEARTELPA